MIHIVIGTKAQLIKMAPVMRAFRASSIPYNFISTGQHRETTDDILENFDLTGPDYCLYSGPDITSIPAMVVWAARIMLRTFRKRREVFHGGIPGIVLVHGDTFSTLMGALMARIVNLPVGHVESGLRSFNWFHPFPEELIRVATFRLSSVLFCPGAWALANVESHSGEKVDTDSNTLADALRFAVDATGTADIDIPSDPFSVVTLHRFENIHSRSALERVISIVERISQNTHLLFILHPPTEEKLREFGFLDRLAGLPHIELRQRYDYFRFIKLLLAADFIVSDGGSNQEECFYLGKPILLLRRATERHEGLGENCVVSGYDDAIVDRFVANWQAFQRPPQFPARSASELIVEKCRRFA